MATLTNSQRRTYKATYTPLGGIASPTMEQPSTPRIQRAIDKSSYVGALMIHESEIAALREALGNAPDTAQALEAVRALATDALPGAVLRHAPRFAGIASDTLVRIGTALANGRQQRYRAFRAALKDLHTAHVQSLRKELTAAVSGAARPERTAVSGAAAAATRTMPTTAVRSRASRATKKAGAVPALSSQPGVRGSSPAAAPQSTGLAHPAVPAVPTVAATLSWAAAMRPDDHAKLQQLSLAIAPKLFVRYGAVSKLGDIEALGQFWNYTNGVNTGFVEQFKVQPIGLLHLERLEMTPVGVERGELVHSVPLTPKETVNISHREWSTRTEEFDQIVTDFFEGFSEEGVAEKSEIAQATESQSRREEGLDVNASLTASYGVVTLATSASGSIHDVETSSQKDSRNHAITVTRKAATRTKKEHKMSFRVSSVAGTEDQAVRVLTNPSDTTCMRVDYYQLIRKWRVDLYRYGLRMTYDIVVPSPGIDLLRKVAELRWIDRQIGEPFAFTKTISDIQPGTYVAIAQELGVSLSSDLDAPLPRTLQPPPQQIQRGQSGDNNIESVNVDIPDGYQVVGGTAYVHYYSDHDDGFFWVDLPELGPQNFVFAAEDTGNITTSVDLTAAYASRSGSVSVVYRYHNVQHAQIEVKFDVTPTPDAMSQWQGRVWAALRDGAQQAYLAARDTLKQRRDQLAAELAGVDALTLRRMEQEEIMKSALRWLLGPDFELTPADIDAMYGPLDATDPALSDIFALQPDYLGVTPDEDPFFREQDLLYNWQRVLSWGELIKFLHQAIEWENALHFAYPYFWDTSKNWDLKRFLDHPDTIHRRFLRAGAARIVLTIRPGFEKAFVTLVDSGAFGQLLPDHPYLTIAQEIEDYANTNYEGIPPANPTNANDPSLQTDLEGKERGQLIARWFEYTSTSALDVAISTPDPGEGISVTT